MTDVGKGLAHRYFEQLLSAPDNLDVADEIFTDDVVFANPVSKDDINGIDEYKAFAQRWYTGFPDRKFEVIEEVAEGDRLAVRFKITGTHNGEFMDVPPTGNPITVHGVNLFWIEGDRIKRVEAYFNPLQIWGPLGIASGAAPGSKG